MPSDRPEVADSVATETLGEASNASEAEERVEQEVPQTSVEVAEERQACTDLSEVIEPAPSSEAATGDPTVDRGTEVKAEGDGADTTQQVLGILGVQEGVADFVATDQPETSEAARPFLEPETSADVDPTQAFDDIDKAKEEVDFTPTEPSGAELAAEVETTDLLGLEEDTAVGADTAVEASEPVDPKPEVADSVATEPTEEIQPPPTSPNLVPPGVEPIQTGHTPATGSRPPRHRSSRGGQTTRWQEASRNWYQDFDKFKVRYWLFHNSGGEVSRGFWLRKYSLSEADRDQRWFVSLFEGIREFLDRDDCLILCYYIWPTYSDWVHQNGLDRRRGLARGRALVEAEDLPPKRIINRGVLGVENPDDSVWDRYYRYQGVNQQPLPKATGRPAVRPDAAQPTFVEPTSIASASAAVPEPTSGSASASAKKRSTSRRPADPEQPSTGWIPTLRDVSHPVASDRPQQPKKKSSSPKPAAGVAVSGRDTTVSSSSAGASPKAPKAKVDTPKASQVSSVATPVAKVGVSSPPSHPPPGNLVESSSASAPPPTGEPPIPAPSIPPPPQEAPPTREELAERAARVAREDPPPDPEDPNDPPDPEEEQEGEWVEEEEEEEPQEEDQAVEGEEAEPSSPQEPEFPDFSSPRSRRHKRPHSNPPVPIRLLTRQQRDDLEIQQQISQAAREIRARPATALTRRGIVLQPAVPGYPETRIDSTGTWARIAGPPVAFAPQPGIRPFAIPAGEDIHINDIYSVPDTYWHNPQLHSRAVTITDNLGPADVVHVAVNDAETESEGEESPARARARFDEARHIDFLNRHGKHPLKLIRCRLIGLNAQKPHHQSVKELISG
eukprot:s1422_g3.t1